MNACFSDVDLNLASDVKQEIMKILITRGRAAEADEMTRQLENLKEIIKSDDTVY